MAGFVINIFNTYYRLLLSVLYGAFIPYTANLGKNIKFPHGLFGIFISMHTEIGDNCTVLHHVTIGSNIDKESEAKSAPKIKDGVFIGCNSCIIGETIIGNNCKIGAGTTIVNSQIPDNCTIVGAKFRIINKTN